MRKVVRMKVEEEREEWRKEEMVKRVKRDVSEREDK